MIQRHQQCHFDHEKVHSANQFDCDMTSGTCHDQNGKYFLDDVRVGKTKKVAPIFTDKIKSFETVNVRVSLSQKKIIRKWGKHHHYAIFAGRPGAPEGP